MSRQQANPSERIVNTAKHERIVPLYDDNIYHIMTFLNPEFIIGTCMMVSKQWNEQARIVPIKLLLDHTLPSIHFNLTHLEWTNENQCMKCVEWILTCPRMVNLTALSLCYGEDDGIGDEGCQLLDCTLMRNLTCLNLYQQSIGNRGCHIIANSSHLTNLRTLELPSNIFDNDGLKELVEGSIMVNLTSLDLSYSENCTNEGFQSLITSPNITNLKSLNLSNSEVKELVFSKPLANLEELDLSHNEMTNITVNSNLCNLTRLNLAGNRFNETTCHQLFQSTSFKLTDLNLSFLKIRDETFRSILSNPQYSKITSLEMRYITRITTKSIPIIVNTLTMLTDLCLNGINMEMEDCQYIAQSPCFSNMTSLSLEDCDIDSEGVKAITSNKSELKYLFLSENEIGNEGCHFIATSPFMIHLETLDLRCNGISREGCESLANSSFLPRLSSLNLGRIYTREGVDMLKSCNHFDECCEIMVDDCDGMSYHSDGCCSDDEESGSERVSTESDED